MTIDYVLFDPGNVTPRGAVDDKCHYSNWTSCSYFCGDEKEEFSYRALLDDSPKARAECPMPEKPCDESVVCTGDIYKPAKLEASFPFLPEPFVFGEWTKTDKCSESCGEEGRVLEQRTCTPTHPQKSCSSLPIERTLRLSTEPCADPPCEGLFSVEIFFIKRKHF